jgi:hypothetical protein
MTHVTNIETIASQLKDLDVHISDDEIMAKILSTLPRTFEHMETAWDSMQSNEKTLDNLRARLIQEEKKIKRRQSENNGSRKEEREALAANRYPPRQESSNDNKAPSNRPENHVYRSNRYCNICRRRTTGPTSIDQVNVKEINMENKDAHKQRETEPIYPTQTKRRIFPWCQSTD